MGRLDKELKIKAASIKWMFVDVDGTLTDGKVYYNQDGEYLKSFSMRDGTGFFLLREAGLMVAIITGEDSLIVGRRAEKLKVDYCFLGVKDKKKEISAFLESNGLSWDNVAYIGDDLNDYKSIGAASIGFAVGDACELVKSAADIVCVNSGGNGAFREAVELLLYLKNIKISDIVNERL